MEVRDLVERDVDKFVEYINLEMKHVSRIERSWNGAATQLRI